MKMTKPGDPDIIRKLRITEFYCIVCGAEFEMNTKEFVTNGQKHYDCEYCKSLNCIKAKPDVLNE